jgi:hypothetical protein
MIIVSDLSPVSMFSSGANVGFRPNPRPLAQAGFFATGTPRYDIRQIVIASIPDKLGSFILISRNQP